MQMWAGEQTLRVTIIGGSIGGLAAGLALDRVGLEVEIYETSSAAMQERGAGLVLQPELAELMERYGVAHADQLVVISRSRQSLSRDGQIVSQQPLVQRMTSWDTIYTDLRRAFPEQRYHHDHRLTGLIQTPQQAIAIFAEDLKVEADLIIAADGANSTVRQLLNPIQPQYAGYVAWRGVISEADLDAASAELLRDRFTFFTDAHTQMLCYLIPGLGGELTPGKRRLNWVWYWDVPETDLEEVLIDPTGSLQGNSVPQGSIQRQHQIAEQILPPVFQDLFKATAEPFVQPILDLAVPRMVFDRVVLLGDAAFIARPHTASGTAKAVRNAADLVDLLIQHPGDLQTALLSWEPQQLRLGRYLSSMGIRYRELIAQSEAM